MRLRTQRVRVAAPRQLVFEVVAAAGKDLGKTDDARLVQFESQFNGQVYKTVEAVWLYRPHRIVYSWIEGPLDGVEEEIALDEIDARTTQMTYRGSFQPASGIVGWFRGAAVVRPIFNRLVRDHLEQGKELAEARALRSRVYQADPPESRVENPE